MSTDKLTELTNGVFLPSDLRTPVESMLHATELHRRATEQTVLYQFTDKLQRATILTEIYDAALDSILSALNCQRASILIFDETNVMRFVGWRGLSEGYRQAVEGHSPWKADEKNPQPICVNNIDLAEIPDSLKAVVKGEGIHALAFIPLVINGKLLGKFMTYYDAPHVFSDQEIELSLIIARQLGFGIERRNTEMQRDQAVEAVRNSERHLRELIEALPAAVYTTDAQGRITMFNQAAVEFSGLMPKLGTDSWCVSWKLYWPDGTPLPHEQCPMAMALKRGKAIRGYEAIAERPDGTRVNFIPYPTPLYDNNGVLLGAINMLVDITDRKKGEQSRVHLASIVESSADAIISKDLNGYILSWNKAAEKIFGYTEVEACGQRVVDLIIPPDRVEEEETILKRIRRGERMEHFETMRIRQDGTQFPVSLTVSPIKDNSGRIIGASKIARDITDRKQTEEAIQQYAEELRQSNKDLEQFASIASHDLQEPLRIINSFIQLLKLKYHDQFDEDGRQFADHIIESATKMQGLVHDLLNYSRVGREMKSRRVNLNDVVNQVIKNLAIMVEENRAEIVSDDLPVMIVDETQVTQLFQNLIGNAIKFRHPQRPPEVHVSSRSEGDSWVFSVKDNGIGIASQHHERIFEIFKRLHADSEYPGSGIGLALCKKIVESHGGKIWLESHYGQGTTFYISFPKKKKKERLR